MSESNFNLEQIFSPTRCISAELLLKYANDELRGEEAHTVERHLVDCPFCEDALEGITMVGTKDFSDLLNEVNATISQHSQTEREGENGKVIEFHPNTQPATSTAGTSRKWFKTLSIAASFLLLATIGVLLLRQPVTPEAIAAEYFQVFELGKTRSLENITANVYGQAKALFQDKKYAEAAPLFDQVDSIQALYSAANCYYMVGNYPLAAARFSAVISKGDGYSEDSEFGLAMTYLMQDNIEGARKLLEAMSQDNRHNYTLMAKDALSKVKNL